MVSKYESRSPYFTNSVMRQRGSCTVTHPMKVMTCGLLPSAIFFMVSISFRKSVLSLPVAVSVQQLESWHSRLIQRQTSKGPLNMIVCKYHLVKCSTLTEPKKLLITWFACKPKMKLRSLQARLRVSTIVSSDVLLN